MEHTREILESISKYNLVISCQPINGIDYSSGQRTLVYNLESHPEFNGNSIMRNDRISVMEMLKFNI